MSNKEEDEFKSSLEAFKKSKLAEAAKIRIQNEVLTQTTKPTKRPYFPNLKFYYFNHLSKPLTLSLVILLFISIGTAQASRSSLPGDFLYSIKTTITEPFIKSTKVTTQERVDFDIELADTRIEELEALITKNETTEENVTANFVLFERHINESKTDEEKDEKKETSSSDLNKEEDRQKAKDDHKKEKQPEKKTDTAEQKEEKLEVRIEKYHELINSVPKLNKFYEGTVKRKLPKKTNNTEQIDLDAKLKEEGSVSGSTEGTTSEQSKEEVKADISTDISLEVITQESTDKQPIDVALPTQKIPKTPKIGL